MLEVRASGGKTFYQRYRDKWGRERQYKIGTASILSVIEARDKGRRVHAEALLGADDSQNRKQQLKAVPTFSRFITETYLPFARSSKRSWRTDETVLRIHILPTIGRLTIDQVSNTHVAKILNRMRQCGYASGTTNRVLVLFRFIFNLARNWGVAGVGKNPSEGFRTAPDVCRERFLTNLEAQRLLTVLADDENQVAAKAIRLLLLTGARRNEITQARWEYVDWEKNTLLVPVSKTGRPRLITLNAPAVDVLLSIARTRSNKFIFPSPVTGRPCPSLHFPWLRVRRKAGLENVRLHDLRHSFASFLVNNGVSLFIVQGLLGHSQPRMTQRYAHLHQQTLLQAAEVMGVALNCAKTSPYGGPTSSAGPGSSEPVQTRSF